MAGAEAALVAVRQQGRVPTCWRSAPAMRPGMMFYRCDKFYVNLFQAIDGAWTLNQSIDNLSREFSFRKINA